MRALLALLLAGAALRPAADMRDVAFTVSAGAAGTVTIDAMPYTRTVTCTGSYTLTGTASGGGAVSWASSPSGDSGACTGTDTWSCAVAVSPDAAGEGVETITVAQAGGGSDTEDIGFYVAGSHSCFLAQSVNGSYNVGLADDDKIGTWVNSGSSAKNVTQAGADTLKPTFKTAIVGGQPVVRFDGGDRLQAATASDWTFYSDGTDTTAEVAAVNSLANPETIQAFLATSNFGGADVGTVLYYTDSGSPEHRASIIMRNGSAAVINGSSADNVLAPTVWHLISGVLDDDGAALPDFHGYVQGVDQFQVTRSGAFSASAPTGALAIGAAVTDAARCLNGDIWRVTIYASALTTEQRSINQDVDAWASNNVIVSPGADAWVYVGNSLTSGSVGVTRWPIHMEAVLPTGYVNRVLAVSGSLAAGAVTQWNDGTPPYPDKLFILAGINDIIVGTGGATVFATLSPLIADAQAHGTTVVIMTHPPFGNYVSWTAGKQTQLDILNAAILASSADVIVDLYAVMGDTDPQDLLAAYDFGDGLHPSNAGTVAIAAAVTTALGL